MFILLLLTAVILLLLLFSPAVLELRKPKDAGPRRILESDGREIVGFSVLMTVYFRENSLESRLLEDIEAPEFSPPSGGFFSISLPDIELSA